MSTVRILTQDERNEKIMFMKKKSNQILYFTLWAHDVATNHF